MGLPGLQKFMKRHDCCEQISLSEIADLYRSETGADPVLLVDISSCVSFFYTSSPSIKTVSGELKNFMENLKTFVNNCKQLGIGLKFFADGKKPPYKYRLWTEKLPKKLDELKEIYFGQRNTCSEPPWRGSLFWIVSNYLSLKDNWEYSRAIYEADSDILKYQEIECFAILTHDSDFIMMNNVYYCLTPENFNLHSMKFFNFNRSNLAKLLKINPSKFPLFASLCPNHFQSCGLLNHKKEKLSAFNGFFEAAELIKDITCKEELVECMLKIMQPEDLTFLEKGLKFYSGKEPDVRHTSKNHWGEIMKLAEERHITGEAPPQILSVMQDKMKFIELTCENILTSSAEYALLTMRKKIYGILFFEHPNPLIFVTEFSYLCDEGGFFPKPGARTVIVDRLANSILLLGASCMEGNAWDGGFKVNRRKILPLLLLLGPHPGLLTLWSLENSNNVKILRMTVFCEAINQKLTAEDFLRLKIPVEYMFPVLAAFYLLWEFDKKFEEFEVETILIQAILVNNLTSLQIVQLPEEFHIEAFNLTGWFSGIVDCLYLLSYVCGEPFCRHKANLVNFFDGKVMHYVYGKMRERENPWMSFSEYEKEYRSLRSALCELGRICGHVELEEKRESTLNGDSSVNQ